MSLTLSDAFNQRKKLGAAINTWINRLTQSGQDRREFLTQAIEGKGAYTPQPGTEKVSRRHYTVEECREKIDQLIQEDMDLALRISLTNQMAKAKLIGLDGKERELTIPELLTLKNDIIPKMESAARSVPVRSNGVNIFEEKGNWIRHRQIHKLEKKKESFQDKLKIEEVILEGYQVYEVTEYGIPQREAWNQIDKIQEFAERVKEAINQANKTELFPIK